MQTQGEGNEGGDEDDDDPAVDQQSQDCMFGEEWEEVGDDMWDRVAAILVSRYSSQLGPQLT